ncbi:MAG: hypothetical protein FWC22_00305 [Treponema sp.]|nr:hypothetical protein [Treponema sp.]
MEELQSTEILDREILDDARKKALRILKQADDTIKAQNAEWEKKTADCIYNLDNKYSEQEKTESDNVMARLPIDKLRLKIEKIENLLVAAEDSWYESLDRNYILKLLSIELGKRLEFVRKQEKGGSDHGGGKELKAFIYMLKRNEAEALLKQFNLSCEIEAIHSVSRYPLITIETSDLMITVSIQRIIDYFLHVKRTELVEALVGRDFMENI